MYENKNYQPGPVFKRIFWYLVSAIFISSFIPWPYGLKTNVLRLFGAQIGEGLVIKPLVRVKHPWKLKIKDHVWIGESVWIDNLEMVEIESNVCISQGAMLLTGNHNYKKVGFDLIVRGIHLKRGVWLGAKSIVCPGVICESHSILTVGSVATKNLEPHYLYRGNPAEKLRKREIFES